MATRPAILSQQAYSLESPALRAITPMVQAVDGINLGQGVCQLPVPEAVIRGAARAMEEGVNRYTNPRGLESLRQALASKLAKYNDITANPETEILITSGSTGALEGICSAFLNPGDEVVSFTPYYPYHENAWRRFDVKVNYVPIDLHTMQIDFAALEQALTEKTKFLLINTPSNPLGKVFTEEELLKIGKIISKYDLYVITDEIYEYMLYDNHKHVSPASLEPFKGRTITIGGYSKTFAITGWRIGYAVMPENLAREVVSLLDSIYICPPAPLQQGVAYALADLGEDFYQDLRESYQRKRDFFLSGLERAGFKPIWPQGSYYVVTDYSELSNLPGMEFVKQMIKQSGVGAVPASDFIPQADSARWLRFCFAVEDSLLENAIANLV